MIARADPEEQTAVPRKRPADRKERILAAAAALFGQRGYRGTSIEDIGAAVGTSGPAIYRHFPSKEALLAELSTRALQRAQRDITDVMANRLPPRETLRAIVERSVSHMIEESDFVVMAAREMRSLSPELRSPLEQEQRVLFGAWISTLNALRPELSRQESIMRVRAALAVAASVSRVEVADADPARELLARMTLAVLES